MSSCTSTSVSLVRFLACIRFSVSRTCAFSTRISATTTSIVRVFRFISFCSLFWDMQRIFCSCIVALTWFTIRIQCGIRNGIICELDAQCALTQSECMCVGFRIEKTQFVHYLPFCLSESPHYYSIFFTNAWRIEKRLPIASEKRCVVSCLILLFLSSSFASLRFDHLRYRNVVETTTTTKRWEWDEMIKKTLRWLRSALDICLHVSRVRMTLLCGAAPVSTAAVWFCVFFFRCLPLF